MNSHLGQGLRFPLSTSVQGGVQISQAEHNIEDCIHIILRTRIGERLYRPNFGCRLAELTFAPLNGQTLLLIRLYVEEALKQWEPRIILEQVETDPDPMRGRVDIKIQYRPTESHDSRSLVHPFYLTPASSPDS